MQIGIFDALQRTEFFKSLRKGDKGLCPCCRRHAQIYRRRLHYTVARQLIILYKKNGYAMHVNGAELIIPGQHGVGDFTKAKYWGLIERRELTDGEVEDGRKSSGWWRLTDKGMSFVLGQATIKEIALVFDDEVLDFEGADIAIKQAFGQHFNYAELMAA